ncbi:putative phosphoesterase [Pseudoxanthobacter soli DSM 19599]|uniref:Putative phosphoesterase n=1 Tax=Pseudoxanthobacter soli DSM 19599 TaxID=1123029 RepID=A0A1M7Z863_9HYPH|nr:ligase-associated DNA damage response endonuclease PdeM [Pseudoxanthobacter soli]SHO61044.1 putative phosphoesterase [Pseudoxanthobacter soli DSM 19599]
MSGETTLVTADLTPVTVAGERLSLHRAGALWWEERRTLVVADLHLEKGSSFARGRQFLPPYDTAATLSRLAEAVDALAPRRVIALGDSFHDRHGPDRLQPADAARLATLVAGRDWVWITGNHDPELPSALGGTVAAEAEIGGLTFRHEPKPGAAPGEIAGHLHPAARVVGRGRSLRRRCFAATAERMVLPAFGALTGGLNVLDSAFAAILPRAHLRVHVIGADRLYTVAAGGLAGG